MHKARAFFFVCAGIFLLALAYHLGARSAGAQSGSDIIGFAVGGPSAQHQYAVTPAGDVWYQNTNGSGGLYRAAPQLIGNFWNGAPTPAQSISIGQLKAKYATPSTGEVNR